MKEEWEENKGMKLCIMQEYLESSDSTYKILIIPSTLMKKERTYKNMCRERDKKERWIHHSSQKSSKAVVGSTKTTKNANEYFVSSPNKSRFTWISRKDNF